MCLQDCTCLVQGKYSLSKAICQLKSLKAHYILTPILGVNHSSFVVLLKLSFSFSTAWNTPFDFFVVLRCVQYIRLYNQLASGVHVIQQGFVQIAKECNRYMYNTVIGKTTIKLKAFSLFHLFRYSINFFFFLHSFSNFNYTRSDS